MRDDLRTTPVRRRPSMPIKTNRVRMELSPNYRKPFLGSGIVVLLLGTTMLRNDR